MKEYDMTLEFPVTIGLSNGNGGDVSVKIDISEEEFDLLVDTYNVDDDINDNEDLDDLCKRIVTAAIDNYEWEYGSNEEDAENAHYFISFPKEVIEEVDSLDEAEDERCLKDIDDITEDELIDVDALVHAFEVYLIENRGYSKGEAEIAASDMRDPYNAPYIYQEYEGDLHFDAVKYQVRYCKTNFMMCGLFELADLEPFEFYMLIDTTSMPDETVGSYTRAPKKYYL